MVEVNEFWNSLDSDTICLVEWLLIGSLGDVPPGSLHGLLLLPAMSTMQSSVDSSRVPNRMGSPSIEMVD